MQTILVPMEELAMLKLDGTLVYVLLVTKEQTAKLVSKSGGRPYSAQITQIFRSSMFF